MYVCSTSVSGGYNIPTAPYMRAQVIEGYLAIGFVPISLDLNANLTMSRPTHWADCCQCTLRLRYNARALWIWQPKHSQISITEASEPVSGHKRHKQPLPLNYLWNNTTSDLNEVTVSTFWINIEAPCSLGSWLDHSKVVPPLPMSGIIYACFVRIN